MGLVSFEMILFIIVSFGLTQVLNVNLKKLCMIGLGMAFVLLCGNQWHLLWLCLVSAYACFGSWLIHRNRKKTVLLMSIVPVVLALCVFKYSSYFGFESLIMPLGISFYTFKLISLFCDVYNGKCQWLGSLDVLAYLMFFPAVSAGPIHRAQSFFVQLNQKVQFNYMELKNSLFLIAMGMFEKIVFADTFADISGMILNNSESKGVFLAYAAVLYSFQLYLDFDAYSNIAVGTSRLLGIRLEKNFRSPYLSKTIMEFWNRWHISLSSWLKDYIYIPLGGNRKGEIRRILHIFVVFLVSGIWHGSTIVFILWGLGHGLLHTVETWIKRKTYFFEKKSVLMSCFQVLVNFSFVTILWVFFRSPDLTSALDLFKRMTMITRASLSPSFVGLSIPELVWTLIVIGITWAIDIFRDKKDMIVWVSKQPTFVRWALYLLLIFMTIVFGAYGPGHNASDFIYISF